MSPIISVASVTKRYDSGLTAIDAVDLGDRERRDFCAPRAQRRRQDDVDQRRLRPRFNDLRTGPGRRSRHRARLPRRPLEVGLVPQEIALDIFATVWNTVSFSRRLFGRQPDDGYLEALLRDLSLWEKRNDRVIELSGGMKRRVMIAKALATSPTFCFWTSHGRVDVEPAARHVGSGPQAA